MKHFVLALLLLITYCGAASAQIVRATVAQGEIEGVDGGSYALYKNIPYAEPPVGNLRWKVPVAKKPWKGVYKADKWGNRPPQPTDPNQNGNEIPMSEDCLYLSVQTPAKTKNDKLPVFVMIHGGAFLTGSYSGTQDSFVDNGIIYCSIEYRLGALGFMCHPALDKESADGMSGNYGIMDQIMALKWIHDNIAAFGGDPDNITIAGESAGGISVSILCASPQCKGLFRRAKPMNVDNQLRMALDHWVYLRLPHSMRQGCSYTVAIPDGIGTEARTATVTFDIWNTPSEAIHVNIIGYAPQEQVKAADLYYWLGDGGSRDYSSFEGKKVYLYNVGDGTKQEVSSVRFWKKAADARYEAGQKNLTGSDVWTIDFREATPGCYRLVVDGVGCSMDFSIADNIYYQPYRYSVRGYYYMRIDEPIDTPRVWPIPRQPRFIPGVSPTKDFVIYKTDLTPWSKEWPRGDGWDNPHFNQRYMWVNAEFTPRETMRGKMALLAYLYAIR